MYEFRQVPFNYAKATFEFAVEHNVVDHWKGMLTFASQVSLDHQVKTLISRGLVQGRLADIFNDICSPQLDQHGQNLIKILAQNGRLALLPEILAHYGVMQLSLEKSCEVAVTTASLLSEQQKNRLASALQKRLGCSIKLNCQIDKTVLAGMVIRAGNWVVDGTMRSRLSRLAEQLQS